MKKRSFGTHAAAQICQVTPPTIVRWMEEGNLPFFTTFGGHRRVWDADLVAFLKAHNIPPPEHLKYLVSHRVVIVDDEDEVRKVIRRVLQKLSPEFEIYEASDGFDAGHKIAQLVPSLVILDIKLPGIDGFKVLKIIRSDERLKNSRILVITGQNVEEFKKRSLNAGADDFLGKPFEANDLKEKITKLLKL